MSYRGVNTVITICLTLVIGLFIYTAVREGQYKRECRANGGVPVFSYGAVNCAHGNFIDLHFQ